MKKYSILLAAFLISLFAVALPGFGQGIAGVPPGTAAYWTPTAVEPGFSAPEVTWAATGLTLTYTSGSVFPGITAQAITGNTLTLTDTKNTCTVSTIFAQTDACNYVYWNTGASLSTSTTFSTAATTGNIVLYVCGTTGGNITGCKPFSLLKQLSQASFLGTYSGTTIALSATTNQIVLGTTNTLTITSPAPAASVTLTVPDPGVSAITANGLALSAEYCGTTTTCAKTTKYVPFVVFGDVTLSSSTATVTALPFTAATFSCSGNDLTTAAGIVQAAPSGTQVVFTISGGAATDHIRYTCVGY